MDFFAHPVMAVILLLGLLVFVHEAGHFIVGKLCGIAVEIFSLGFGPVILNFQRGETNYRLSLIPLGGFVKFYGATRKEDVPEELRGKEFYRASVWKRALTILAGPFANFLLAVTAYTGMVMVGIPQPPPLVGEIMVDSPASRAGFQFQDRITAINGEPVETWRDLQAIIMDSPGKALDFQVKRGEEQVKLHVVPDNIHDADLIGKKFRGQIGISPSLINSSIAITSPDSPAAKAGIKTGERIVGVKLGDKEYEVKFWRTFVALAQQAQREGVKSLPIKTQGAGKDAPVHDVVLDLSGWKNPASMSELGLTHALLVMAPEKIAEAAPLREGDLILKLDNHVVTDAFDFRTAMLAVQKPEIPVTFLRDGQVLIENVKTKPVDVQKAEGRVTMYTFPGQFLGQLEQPDFVIEKRSNIFSAFWYGVKETGVQIGMISTAVAGLFTGDMPLEALGGPISIAKVASDSVKMGWMSFFSALGLVSVNLGLLNLFPIPVLDGGQLVLVGAEAIRRRPLGDLAIENFQKIGFVMVLALIAMATYNDLSRFWSSMLKGFSGIFQ